MSCHARPAAIMQSMRIIAGTHRGRLLLGPRGSDTRPITDRVKVNLFNILGDRVEDAVVADCFCGTGSLGIECLSRGAAHVVFAEIAGPALRLLKENLATLGLAAQATVLRHDVLRKGLPTAPQRAGRSAGPDTGAADGPARPAGLALPGPSAPFSLAFLDPPYEVTRTQAGRLWLKLDEGLSGGLLAPGTVVVWRHEAGVELEPPAGAAGRLRVADRRRYGSQVLTFLEVDAG